MWTKEVVDMILKGIQETLYMTLLSTLMGYVIGLPMGVLLQIDKASRIDETPFERYT